MKLTLAGMDPILVVLDLTFLLTALLEGKLKLLNILKEDAYAIE